MCLHAESVKQFFTDDALKTVEAIMMIKQEGYNYYCKICELEIDNCDDHDESINCSSCLGWTHFKCTGLKIV